MRRALLAAVLMVAAGCAPQDDVHLSIRDLSSDVVYGDQSKPTPPAPAPAATIQPTFPSFIQPPAVVRPVTAPPTEPVDLCPTAQEGAFPLIAATPRVLAPPVPALYLYRQTGTVTIAGEELTPPEVTTREVLNIVVAENGTFTFDVIEDQFVAKTTTTYLVDQRGSASSDGIFITHMLTESTDAEGEPLVEEFTPVPPVKIMPLPAAVSSNQFASAGTDALRGTSMAVRGTIAERSRVDACGTVLDAWRVELEGLITGPARAQSFTSSYDIATHYGGLILSDHLVLTGVQGGLPVDRDTTATITVEPVRPEGVGG